MSDETKPAKPPKIVWTTLLKGEELAAARERLRVIKHEFSVVYGLKWTEYDTFSGRRRSLVSFETFHAEAVDHGPLSYWNVEEETPGGARKKLGGGDSIAYSIAIIEAMETLLEALDARAALAAEALKDPEPVLGGATGPMGSTGWAGPAPTQPMAPGAAVPNVLPGFTSIAGPVGIWGATSGAVGVTGPVGGSAPAPATEDDEDDEP